MDEGSDKNVVYSAETVENNKEVCTEVLNTQLVYFSVKARENETDEWRRLKGWYLLEDEMIIFWTWFGVKFEIVG